VLAENDTYGSSWQRPSSMVDERLVTFAVPRDWQRD
jgi:hypothetical protein